MPQNDRDSRIIGERIRVLRQQLGLSQKQLAGRLMTRNFISMVENGRALPSKKNLSAIALCLGQPLEFFIAGTNCTLEDAEDAESTSHAVVCEAENLVHDRRYQEAIDLLTANIGNMTNPAALAASHYLQMRCYIELALYDAALVQGEQALHYYRELDDRLGMARVSLQEGALLFAMDDFVHAKAAFERAALLSAGLKTAQHLHIRSLKYLGTTLLRRGCLDEAIHTYQQAAAEARFSDDPELAGASALGLGTALFRAGRPEEAITWTRKALDVYRRAQHPDWVLAQHNLATIQIRLGPDPDATAALEECLDVYRAQGRTDKQASILEELAASAMRSGQLEHARAMIREALEKLTDLDETIQKGRLYRLLGVTYQRSSDREQASAYLKISYDLFRVIRATGEMEETKELLLAVRGASPSGASTEATQPKVGP